MLLFIGHSETGRLAAVRLHRLIGSGTVDFTNLLDLIGRAPQMRDSVASRAQRNEIINGGLGHA